MVSTNKKKPELLLPAGSLETVKSAVYYGADAIYMGTPDMSMRTKSKLSLEELIESTEFAHAHGVRVYLTLNLISHNKDIAKLPSYIETVRKVSPDGLIISDPGVFAWVQKNAPEIPLHISTQSNVCSWLTVDYWKDQGAALVVLGREVNFKELCEIREKCPDIRIEVFVHGAMCMTYSGRCLLSNFMAERGANQGNCANSCRWNYKLHIKLKDGSQKEIVINEDNQDLFEFFLEEGYRPGDLMPFEESERGSYILNSKDLCLMPKLDEYMKIGVDTLKIEGRNRSPYYISIAARAYRHAIDDWFKDPENWSPKEYLTELETIGNRGFTLAFHDGRLTNYAHGYESTATIAEWEFAGMISEVFDDYFLITVKNKFEAGDVLEFLPFKTKDTINLRLYEFEMSDGKVVTEINAGQQQEVKIPFSAFDHEDPAVIRELLKPHTLVRKERSLSEAQWARIKLDKTASRLEADDGTGSEILYKKNTEELKEKIAEDILERRPKSPRHGTSGCCGKGCNGCMIFWNDPKYEKARKLLADKKQGEMLKTEDIEEMKRTGEI